MIGLLRFAPLLPAVLSACATIGAGSVNRDRLDYNQALASSGAVPQAPVITVPAS